MKFFRADASDHLNHFIQWFWCIEDFDQSKQFEEAIIPDGFPELIFHYGDPYEANISGKWEKQGDCLLAGQIRNHFSLRNTGRIGMFAIKLQPWTPFLWWNIEGVEIVDKVIDLKFNSEMLEKAKGVIHAYGTFDERVSKLEDLITESQGKISTNYYPLFSAIELLFREKGQSSIESLCKKAHCSERTLERYFKRIIGLTPKFYSRIIRFSYIFEQLKKDQYNWSEVAQLSGYYDQSHFIKNFKEFTGEDPTTYGYDKENMANFFLRK